MEFLEGTPGIMPEGIRRLLVLGGGRTPDGEDSGPDGQLRAFHATLAFASLKLAHRGGRLILSGNKTPRDPNKGGRPEAESMQGIVLAPIMKRFIGNLFGDATLAPDASHVVVETDASSTIGNLANAAGKEMLGITGLTVGIVSQADHLERVLDTIAPKILAQPYIGVVAPTAYEHKDPSDSSTEIDTSQPIFHTRSRISEALQRGILYGINPRRQSRERILRATERRSSIAWFALLPIERLLRKIK